MEYCVDNKNHNSALTGVARLVGCGPTKQKVSGSIPSCGRCLGCWLSSKMGCVQEATSQCFSLTFMFVSLCHSLSSSLCHSLKINFKNLLKTIILRTTINIEKPKHNKIKRLKGKNRPYNCIDIFIVTL